MSYIKQLPETPTFTQEGLKGYQFSLKNNEVEIYHVNVTKGHDYIVSRKITHIYYVLDGNGYFIIDGIKYDVKPNMLIEVPPNVEYCYGGSMELLFINNPPWFAGNEYKTKDNPDVHI